MPLPRYGPYRTLAETGVTVAIDTGFSAYVRAGRVRIVSQIDHFGVNDVALVDGVRIQPDVVLLATGYRPRLQPLVGHLQVLNAEGHPRLRADGIRSVPGLWFIGFTPMIEGTLRQQAIEARRIAQRISSEPD